MIIKNISQVIILLTFILAGCNTNIKKTEEINLYSQRHYTVDKKQYENFEKQTGIKINVVKAGADELIERFNKFAAKNKVSAALAADERAKFTVAMVNIENPDLVKRAKEQNKLDKLNK